MDYIITIGLETHIQLNTETKLFSRSSTVAIHPNQSINLIDIGGPGALPKINSKAIDKAILFGLNIGGSINKNSFFERKHYFYPDNPKSYQISQQESPIIQGGSIDIGYKKITIHHAHLEEDAGKSIHDNLSKKSFIDLNRCGIPLIEVVSNPDIESIEEAVLYAKSVYRIARYLNITNGNLEEGNFRIDANISIRKNINDPLGVRCEIKNINSFKFLKESLIYEYNRQCELLDNNQQIERETRGFDSDKKTTYTLRSKEQLLDYKYMFDPDIPFLNITEERMNNVLKNNISISDFIHILKCTYLIQKEKIDMILENVDFTNIFKYAINNLDKKIDPVVFGKLLTQYMPEILSRYEVCLTKFSIDDLIELSDSLSSNKITHNDLKNIMNDFIVNSIAINYQLSNLKKDDTNAVIVREIKLVFGEHKKELEELVSGREKVLGFFMGKLRNKVTSSPQNLRDLILKVSTGEI